MFVGFAWCVVIFFIPLLSVISIFSPIKVLLSLCPACQGLAAATAAKNMHMGAAGFFKHPGHQYLIHADNRPANRADPLAASVQAVSAAPDVHHPALAGHSREGGRFDPFLNAQFGGTNRANPGIAGPAVFYPQTILPAGIAVAVPLPLPAVFIKMKKQDITKPDEDYPNNRENQQLKQRIHKIPPRPTGD
jgi:hypothetical protein